MTSGFSLGYIHNGHLHSQNRNHDGRDQRKTGNSKIAGNFRKCSKYVQLTADYKKKASGENRWKPWSFYGAEGRTRTGTPSLTADFEFLHGVSRRFVLSLTTSLKPPDFTGLVRHLLSAFRPSSPYKIWGLGSQKVVKIISLSSSFPSTNWNFSY